MEKPNQGMQGQHLQEENDFLKLKMMLERGAEFGNMGEKTLTPEVENVFLKRVMAFEAAFDNPSYIKVFDKIDRPEQFRKVAEIDESEIALAWEELSDYLNRHSIDLTVCSPNVGPRELYRFATEELFKLDIEDINIPGMMHCFIYDEFYPDPVYDNGRIVEEDLLPAIFCKEPMRFDHWFATDGIFFNGNRFDSFPELKDRLQVFKNSFESISLQETKIDFCAKPGLFWLLKGSYRALVEREGHAPEIWGRFTVEMSDSELGFWLVKKMELEGVDC